MVNVSLIVGISSSYSGIFKETKMLVSLKKHLKDFSKKTSSYFVIFLSSIISGAIACNQSLSLIHILYNQLKWIFLLKTRRNEDGKR